MSEIVLKNYIRWFAKKIVELPVDQYQIHDNDAKEIIFGIADNSLFNNEEYVDLLEDYEKAVGQILSQYYESKQCIEECQEKIKKFKETGTEEDGYTTIWEQEELVHSWASDVHSAFSLYFPVDFEDNDLIREITTKFNKMMNLPNYA